MVEGVAKVATPSPFLSMRRKASVRSAQLSHAGWCGDMCLGTEGRGAILIPASEDKVKLKSSGSGPTQNSDTWRKGHQCKGQEQGQAGTAAATLEYLGS